jgi:hypothetical protein
MWGGMMSQCIFVRVDHVSGLTFFIHFGQHYVFLIFICKAFSSLINDFNLMYCLFPLLWTMNIMIFLKRLKHTVLCTMNPKSVIWITENLLHIWKFCSGSCNFMGFWCNFLLFILAYARIVFPSEYSCCILYLF